MHWDIIVLLFTIPHFLVQMRHQSHLDNNHPFNSIFSKEPL